MTISVQEIDKKVHGSPNSKATKKCKFQREFILKLEAISVGTSTWL